MVVRCVPSCSGVPHCLQQWVEDDAYGDSQHSPDGHRRRHPGQRHDWLQLTGAPERHSDSGGQVQTFVRRIQLSQPGWGGWMSSQRQALYISVKHRSLHSLSVHAMHVQASELFAAANQTASEAFAAIRTVAAFSLQGQLGSLYKKLLDKPQACIASLYMGISMPHDHL